MPPYVLVVESDPELQRRIGETLREANYDLSAEAEAKWAKRSLLVRTPDAVIVDTGLADGSGFQVADALRGDPDTQQVPIFFIASRYRGASHRAEARRRFAPAEWLTTPLDVDTLLAQLLQLVPPTEPSPTPVPDYPGSAPPDAASQAERRVVERQARHLSAEAELRGSLSRLPFARVLHRIYAERLTGALLLVRDRTKKLVYFDAGYPVSVRSNVLAECLGQILLSQRLISREVLDESLRRMEIEGKPQGAVLVEMGALSPFNLGRALIAQMEAKLYDIFAWRSGDFAFKKGRSPRDQPVRLDKAPAALILEGIRRHYDQERVRAVLDPFAGQYVVRNPDPRQRLQDITADPAELAFIESLDGTSRLESLLASARIPLGRVRLLLVAMSEAGMIVPSRSARSDGDRRGVPGRPQRAGDSGGERLMPRDDVTPPVNDVRPADQLGAFELGALVETMRGQTHFEVLEVDGAASNDEIEAAYDLRAREFHPDRFRARSEEVRALAQEVFERLGTARAVLRDPNRRRKYEAALERERVGRTIEQPIPFFGKEPPGAAAERVYWSGVEHLRARRYRDAVQAFRQATSLAPSQASYHSALGWALYRQSPADPGAAAAALAALERAVDLEPDNPDVRVSLGRFHAETGHPDEAITELENALRISPGVPDIEEEIRRLRGQT